MTARRTVFSQRFRRFFGFAGGLGILVWVLQAALHQYAFQRETFVSSLIRPDGHELALRVLSISALLTLAWLCARGAQATRPHQAEEEATRRDRDFADSLIDTAQVIILVLDTEGRIVRVNPYFEDLTGYRSADVLGKCWFETFLPIDDRASVRDLFRKAVHDVHTRGNTNPILTKDGAQRDIEWYDKTLKDAAGRTVGVLAIGQDVTEKLRAERQQAELESQVRQSQKLEAIGQLAGGVAHDFNNILTAIFGNVELAMCRLADTASKDDPLQAELAQIKGSADRAACLTRQLMAFSRNQVGTPEVIDLNHTTADLEKMLRRLITEDIELVTEFAPGLHPVYADASQIGQAILNMVINARDAMPQGGTIRIKTENVDLDDTYVSAQVDASVGPHAVIIVEDTGCGMTEDVRNHIFEPFYTTKAVGQGTGLGLATTYGLVRQAKGHITVSSVPNCGSTFRIYLPARAPVEASPSAHQGSGAVMGSEVVLLCEDDEAVRMLAEEVLLSAGYTVLTCQDGEEALETARSQDTPIHVLVTDVLMPKMNGKELAKALSTHCPGLRTLFVSGHSADIIGDCGVLSDRACFLQKPFSPTKLLHQVRQLLDRVEVSA